MRIQHNIMAMSAYRNYTNNVSAMKKNLEKLSSGYKINRAGDDAAGLAISEKMRAQITGLETAQKNAKDGISLVQTAEGALTEVHDMLNRMVELATQSANGTYDNDVDRLQMQKELNQLREEIDRIADSSNFNGIKLLDGSMSADEVNTDAFTIGTTADDAPRDVSSDILGAIATTVGTAVGETMLHEAAASAKVGTFKLAVDQLSVAAEGKAGKNTSIVITIGTAAAAKATISAANSTAALTGSAIASAMKGATAKTQFIIATKGGGLIFSSAHSGTGSEFVDALVYKATGAASGVVSYKLDGYTTSTKSYKAIADSTALAALPASVTAKLSGAAGANLNFEVDATAKASYGTLTDGRPNKGVLNAQNTVLKGQEKLGNTRMSCAAASLADGMTFVLGTGTGANKTTATIKLTGTGAAGTAVDLRDLAGTDGKIKAGNEIEAMNRIAAKLNTNTGIYIGVDNNGNFTLSEKTDGKGVSAANTATKKAMSSIASFQSLLKVQQEAPAGATNPSITITGSQVKEGDSLTISGTKYVFTKQTMADNSAAKVKYVKIASNATGSAVAAALVAKVGNSNVVQGTGTAADTVILKGDIKLGGSGHNLVLQIGDTAEKFNQLDVAIKDMHVSAMGAGVKADGTMDYTTVNDISIATQSAAQAAVDVIKRAINYVSDMRGTLGATQNRLDHTMNNLSVMTENIQDAESTIRDVDIAEEMMAYTKNNILIQSAQAMLAQANQVPQGVLQLLQ